MKSPLAAITCNGEPIMLTNCAHIRLSHCVMSCARFGKLSDGQCEACGVRVPILTNTPHRMSGLGDLVAAAITIACFGQTHRLQRLVGRIERMIGVVSRKRQKADPAASPNSQASNKGGCGCKARQQRLNELLPFRDSHAN